MVDTTIVRLLDL